MPVIDAPKLMTAVEMGDEGTSCAVLKTIADHISSQAAALSEYLSAHRLPEPSFTFDKSQSFLTSSDSDLQRFRGSLIESCQMLLDLVTGPDEFLKFNVPVSIQFNSALAVAVRFNFARNVPTDPRSSISFEELAKKIGLHSDRVTRIVRCISAFYIFDENPVGYVRHTAASRMLLNPGMIAWLGHQFEEMLPASASLAASFERYPNIESDRETAFSIAHSGEQLKTYWEVLESTPGRVKRFSDALEYITSSSGPGDFRPVVACYDWKKFGATTLVDVGGSSGRVSACIAEYADPGLKFIVQDLPELEEESNSTIVALGMKDQITFQPHNFFEPQPIKDAKVYVYRQILHDWPDKMAVEILRACIPALNAGDYVLLLEAVQSPPGILPNNIERLVRATDLLMMSKHNAKERTLDMWRDLVQDADKRFVLESVTSPEQHPSAGSVIQFKWCP